MSYKYISIPTSRLSEEWLKNHNFDLDDDINTFITYHIASTRYDHYDFIGSAEEDFLCNKQEEFEQMVTQAKLGRIL